MKQLAAGGGKIRGKIAPEEFCDLGKRQTVAMLSQSYALEQSTEPNQAIVREFKRTSLGNTYTETYEASQFPNSARRCSSNGLDDHSFRGLCDFYETQLKDFGRRENDRKH